MGLKLPSRLSHPEPGASRRLVMAIYTPQHYEPRYRYPLLVLLHGRGGDEAQLLGLMPRLSRRNYVAVALRGPEATQPRRNGSVGYGWGQAAHRSTTGEGAATQHLPRIPSLSKVTTDFLADYVFGAVRQVQKTHNVHAGRIFLVGYGEGAAAAYRLGLGMPMQFAGVIALNGWMPRVHGPLLWLPAARRLRLLLVHGKQNQLVPVTAAKDAYRLLYTAGIDTTLRLLDSGHKTSRLALDLINHWLMDHCDCCTASTRNVGQGFRVEL